MTVAILVEARMGSTRLPGKHMRPILGRPMLAHLLERMKLSRTADVVCLATTDQPADGVLADWAEALGVACHRGDVDDVLARNLGAARAVGADVIVEITGDCPLADPAIVDLAVRRHARGDADYVTNVLDRLTYPIGFDVQVFATDLLAEVDRQCADAALRADVTPYIYRNGRRYRLVNLDAPPPLHRPGYRLCVDYAEDLALVRAVYGALYPRDPAFAAADVVAFLDRDPELARSNVVVADAFACPDSGGTARHEPAAMPEAAQ